jgi:hypothetical protein
VPARVSWNTMPIAVRPNETAASGNRISTAAVDGPASGSGDDSGPSRCRKAGRRGTGAPKLMRRREFIAGLGSAAAWPLRRGRSDRRLLGNPAAARVVNQGGPSTSRRLCERRRARGCWAASQRPTTC